MIYQRNYHWGGGDLVSRRLATIDPKLKGTILILFSRTRNQTNTIIDLSTLLQLGAILLAIDINWTLATIDPKLKRLILNLFSRTRNQTNTICDLSTLLQL